jgi:hypothetical protein
MTRTVMTMCSHKICKCTFFVIQKKTLNIKLTSDKIQKEICIRMTDVFSDLFKSYQSIRDELEYVDTRGAKLDRCCDDNSEETILNRAQINTIPFSVYESETPPLHYYFIDNEVNFTPQCIILDETKTNNINNTTINPVLNWCELEDWLFPAVKMRKFTHNYIKVYPMRDNFRLLVNSCRILAQLEANPVATQIIGNDYLVLGPCILCHESLLQSKYRKPYSLTFATQTRIIGDYFDSQHEANLLINNNDAANNNNNKNNKNTVISPKRIYYKPCYRLNKMEDAKKEICICSGEAYDISS